MNFTVLGLITIGVFGIFYVVFTWKSGKKPQGATTTSVAKPVNNTAATAAPTNTFKGPKSDIQRKDMLSFIDFEKIVDDMIVQEKETKYTMVIQCKGINYDLMSEVEQIAVEEGFITFLNTLKSPIQLYVQARTIDLRTSLNMYKDKVNEISQKFNESNDKLKRLSENIQATDTEVREATLQREKLANMSEYAQDITKYVERLSLNKHMLQRKFYVILSYYKSEVNSTTKFTESELYDICYRELYTRAQSVIGALQACSVSAKVLNSNELAELLYISYNRDDEKLLDVKTALDSGFYRMYSTTKDVQEKKRESMQKIIQEEAMNRVEDAIRTAIKNGIIKTKEDTIEEFENETDIAAVKILQETNIHPEDKRRLQEIIVNKHNHGVEERQKEREARQQAEEAKQHAEEETNKPKEENNVEVKSEEIKIEESKPEENKQNDKVGNDTIISKSDDSIV